MKIYILIYLFLSLLSCMPEEELPMKNMGTIPGYFIECYCKPGEVFALSATKILPVTGNITPDHSVEMNISIQADTALDLIHTRYTLPGSSFIYNYGHATRLQRSNIDTLYLNIDTPQQEHITAKTVIPDDIEIYSHDVTPEYATIKFQTSKDPTQNYYIYSLQLGKRDSIFKKEVIYLNLSHYQNGAFVDKTIECPQINDAETITLNLMRITEDCYNYQISLYEANSANQGSITTPVPLLGNIQGALGIFTCYTEKQITFFRSEIRP